MSERSGSRRASQNSSARQRSGSISSRSRHSSRRSARSQQILLFTSFSVIKISNRRVVSKDILLFFQSFFHDFLFTTPFTTFLFFSPLPLSPPSYRVSHSRMQILLIYKPIFVRQVLSWSYIKEVQKIAVIRFTCARINAKTNLLNSIIAALKLPATLLCSLCIIIIALLMLRAVLYCKFWKLVYVDPPVIAISFFFLQLLSRGFFFVIKQLHLIALCFFFFLEFYFFIFHFLVENKTFLFQDNSHLKIVIVRIHHLVVLKRQMMKLIQSLNCLVMS